jgi:hypothetical protein
MLRDPFAAPKQSSSAIAVVVSICALVIAVVIGVSRAPLYAAAVLAALGALSAWFVLRLVERLGVAPERAYWLAIAVILGTGFLTATKGALNGWGRAGVVAMPLLLLALLEAYGRGRPWVCGLLLAAAFALRPYAIFCAPFLLVALLSQKPGSARRVLRSAGLFVATAATGLIAQVFVWRWSAAPAWMLPIIASALTFLGAPRDIMGLALPLFSPFVAALAFADWGRRSAVALWLSLGLSALSQIVSAGLLAVQWRPSVDALDYLPMLVVPVAIAFNQASRNAWIVWRILMVLSIALQLVWVTVWS